MCLGMWKVVLVGGETSNIVLEGWVDGGGVVARLVSLLPLLATLLELPRCRVLLLLLLLRATPFPARVADAVLGGARVLREVGAGEAGWTLAA